MTNIILIGPPGAGKGTQAKKLGDWYFVPHISTGDIFRDAYLHKTELGIRAHDEYWGKGELVPDNITNELAFEKLKLCNDGFMLDGFPRTLPQAYAVDKFLAREGMEIDVVLYFNCPDELLVERITSRQVCGECGDIYGLNKEPRVEGKCDNGPGVLYQRNDDTENTARLRLEEYREKTAILLGYYSELNLLREADASVAPEEVFKSLVQIIEEEA